MDGEAGVGGEGQVGEGEERQGEGREEEQAATAARPPGMAAGTGHRSRTGCRQAVLRHMPPRSRSG